MLYITGLQALNLPCSLNTTGDWHTSSIQWDKLHFVESDKSLFQEYGIEICNKIPDNDGQFYVANHIRAILDLLADKKFDILGNFKDDFICNEEYTEELFYQVKKLLPDKEISDYLHKIYGRRWRIWIGEQSTEK